MRRTINVENNEMFETPFGEVGTFKGASHNKGGIDATVPVGTKIYSDKIKVGEHTMAERKAWRSRKIADLLSKNGDTKDPIIKNGVARIIEAFKMQEEHDLTIQELAKETESAVFEGGTGAAGVKSVFDPTEILLRANPEWKRDNPYYRYSKGMWSRVGADGSILSTIQKGDEAEKTLNNYYFKNGNFSTSLYTPDVKLGTPDLTVQTDGVAPEVDIQDFISADKDGKQGSGPRYENPPASVPKANSFGNLTAGDYIGMANSVIGPVAQMVNTLQNAKATKPVVNHFEGFNENALRANQENIDELGYSKDIAKRALERILSSKTQTARNRTRGSATSINSLRAMDLGVDLQTNEALIDSNNQLESSYSQQKMGLLGTKTQLLSQKDEAEMRGATMADDANAANLDNFYTNFGQNLADLTETGQALGRNLNQSKMNSDFLKILPVANRWGIGFDEDMNIFSSTYK